MDTITELVALDVMEAVEPEDELDDVPHRPKTAGGIPVPPLAAAAAPAAAQYVVTSRAATPSTPMPQKARKLELVDVSEDVALVEARAWQADSRPQQVEWSRDGGI